MNQKSIGLLVAVTVGLIVAWYAYERVTDPLPGMQRAQEEGVVMAARALLAGYVEPGPDFELVDPVSPNRKVGKVYIYPTESGWELSGHYKRNKSDRWHPWLMSLDTSMRLQSLSVSDTDPALVARAAEDPRFSVAQ